jgi:hypothetical protein
MLIILPQHNCTQEETGLHSRALLYYSFIYGLLPNGILLSLACGRCDLYCDGRSVQESWHYHRGLALHGILLSLAGSE